MQPYGSKITKYPWTYEDCQCRECRKRRKRRYQRLLKKRARAEAKKEIRRQT